MRQFCLNSRQVSFFAIVSYEESLAENGKVVRLDAVLLLLLLPIPPEVMRDNFFLLILKSGKISFKRGECDEFPLRLPLY